MRSHHELSSKPHHKAQSFTQLRQPLLLIPFLTPWHGTLSWEGVELALTGGELNIEYERKTLRKLLVPEASVYWSGASTATTAPAPTLLDDIPSRDLLFIKTLQHYAKVLPRPEIVAPS